MSVIFADLVTLVHCILLYNNADGVNELQQFVIRAMVKWSKEEIFDPNLISQIFSLLYRQYDEMNEVIVLCLAFIKHLLTFILIF